MPGINDWKLFTVLFGLLLAVTYIMSWLSRKFYTRDGVVRKFSMMELEMPSTPAELKNLIAGLYLLEPAQSTQSVHALRSQLILDFLFMPLAYGSISILCWKVSDKMQLPGGREFFVILGFLQIIPWICDMIENIYLLGKIHPLPVLSQPGVHKNYLRMEAFKWGITLTAIACSLSAVCYFWLTGNYSHHSFIFLLIVLLELTVYLVLSIFLKHPDKSRAS